MYVIKWSFVPIRMATPDCRTITNNLNWNNALALVEQLFFARVRQRTRLGFLKPELFSQKDEYFRIIEALNNRNHFERNLYLI